jgi:hypothetical protein
MRLYFADEGAMARALWDTYSSGDGRLGPGRYGGWRRATAPTSQRAVAERPAPGSLPTWLRSLNPTRDTPTRPGLFTMHVPER